MKTFWILAALFVAGCASTPTATAPETGAQPTTAAASQPGECPCKADPSKCNHGEHAKGNHAKGQCKHGQGQCKGHQKGHGKMGFHHSFANPEDYVAKWNGPDREAWQKPNEILAAAGFAEGMTVADIGTGTGYFVPYLSKSVGATGKVLALDIEQAMVDYVTKSSADAGLTNVEVRKITTDGPGTPDGALDRIIIVNVWHHIDSRETYAATLLKALKPGGKVAIVDFKKDSPMGPPVEHRLLPEQIEAELKAGGFTTELLPLELERQFVVVGTRP